MIALEHMRVCLGGAKNHSAVEYFNIFKLSVQLPNGLLMYLFFSASVASLALLGLVFFGVDVFMSFSQKGVVHFFVVLLLSGF